MKMKSGHGGQDLFLHEADGLEHGQVEDHVAEGEVAEGERQEDQREGDREPDEDGEEEDAEQDEAEDLVAHRCCSRITRTHFTSSTKPWSSMRTAVTGITAFNG